MKEVEVKIRIGDCDEVLNMLKNQGFVFSDPVSQRDIVYIPNEIPTVPAPAGTNVLRLRTQGHTTIFTLKRSDKGNHLSKLELESEIKSPGQVQEIIRLLGYKMIADTTKIRYKCKAGEYEICVDQVNGLGNFLEIEALTERNSESVQEEMLKFLHSKGLNISQRVMVGYDVLYVQSRGHKK